MRIAFITMKWPAASETFAARDVKALIKRGNFVKVFALRPDFRNDVKQLSRSLDVQNVQSQRANGFYILKGFFACLIHTRLLVSLVCFLIQKEKNIKYILKSLILFPSVFQTFRKLNQNNFDVIHLFWGHYPSLLGYLLMKSKKHKYTMFLGPYDLRYNYALTSYAAKNAEVVFTHAKVNKSNISTFGVYQDKIKVVYRGIEISHEKNSKKITNSFIFAGRVTREKGVFETIKTFYEISKKVSDATLTIVGDGSAISDVGKLIKELSIEDKVYMKGWLSPVSIMKEFKKSEYIFLLSHVDCLPNVLKEAMLMRAVPIASKTTAIDEMINHGINGLIVDYTKTPAEIAELVLKIMFDEKKWQAFSDSARKKIVENFNVDKSAKFYEAEWIHLV